MTYTERSVFEGYRKNENDPNIILTVSHEVLRDGTVIASEVEMINLDEKSELGSSWDETTICTKYTYIRRADLIKALPPVVVTPVV